MPLLEALQTDRATQLERPFSQLSHLVSAPAHPCLLANFLTLEICLSQFSLHKEKTSQTRNALLGYRHTKSALHLLRETVSPLAIDTSQSPGLKNSIGFFFKSLVI